MPYCIATAAMMGGPVGRHAFSPDGVTWAFSNTPAGAYNTTIVYDDGSTHTLARRERPHLIFNKTSGAPMYLLNGVMQPDSGDYSYTFIQPVMQ
jgi:hypothetical protein